MLIPSELSDAQGETEAWNHCLGCCSPSTFCPMGLRAGWDKWSLSVGCCLMHKSSSFFLKFRAEVGLAADPAFQAAGKCFTNKC